MLDPSERSGAGARLDPKQIEAAVKKALVRVPKDKKIKKPIIIGIVIYPRNEELLIESINTDFDAG